MTDYHSKYGNTVGSYRKDGLLDVKINDFIQNYIEDNEMQVVDMKFTSVYDPEAKDIYHTVLFVTQDKKPRKQYEEEAYEAHEALEAFELEQEKKRELNDNDPKQFSEMNDYYQGVLLDWIAETFTETKTFANPITSYGLKHKFEQSMEGFYITNGMFKGAMLEAGFQVQNKHLTNWSFNISRKFK